MYLTYEEFNAATSFEAKIGFTLSTLQKQDIITFIEWRRSLNRYEVGGGKTVVSTAVSLMGDAEVTVVIVLPVLVRPWVKWLNKVSERVLRYEGTPAERKNMKMQGHRWIVMTHAIFRKEYKFIHEVHKGRYVDLIVDEAQAIKNPESILYNCVGRFTERDHGGLQKLTGTPTSTPMDAYAYLRLQRTDFYRSYEHFDSMHVASRGFFKEITEYKNLDLLSERFAFRSIRRSKEELHGYDLKPLYPDTEYELAPDHQAFYEMMVEEQLIEFDDNSVIDLAKAGRLRHALQQVVVNYDFFSRNPKNRSRAYDLIDLTIEQTECLDPAHSKLIIWTFYKLTSRNVLAYLAAKGIKAVGAYGEVNSPVNTQRFMEDPTVRVGVFQYQSAGAGLEPQFVCWENLFLEVSTVPIYMTQATGRTNRMGQKHVPTMRLATALNTVQVHMLDGLLKADERVVKVERTKKSLRDMLLGK